MPAKHYNLDTRTDMGGESSSDILVSSQKATKTYVDGQVSGKADTNHTQSSNTINSLEDYAKGTITGALSPSDSLNQALGKLENNLDSKADTSEVTLVTIKDWTVS